MLEKKKALKLAKGHVKAKYGLELESKGAEYLNQGAIDKLIKFKLENGIEAEAAQEYPHWVIYFDSKPFFANAQGDSVVCLDLSLFMLRIYDDGEIKSIANA